MRKSLREVKNHCYLIRDLPVVTLRRTAAIGDVIASTVVADKLAELGYDVTFQAHPHIQPLVRRHRNTKTVADPSTHADINLDGCYENHPERTKLHFSDLFLESANKQLVKRGISLGGNINCLATLEVTAQEKLPYLARLGAFEKPWIFICPRSQAWVNRTVPAYVWEEVARLVPGSKFWLGTDDPPKGITDLRIKAIGELPLWLSCADLLVSVDTGPLHVAAAVGTPCLAIEQASSPDLHLSDQRDFMAIRHPDLDCLNCQKNICPKAAHIPPCQAYPPELIAEMVNKRLRSMFSEDITAVIPAHRAPLDRLVRCIECVQPQVSEIIVTCDASGVFPAGVPRRTNIRYIQHRLPQIGLGRNVNFGFRHANGKYVLMLNDDVFLKPDAVSKLMECMKPDVGLVGHLLYYQNGTIQHGGKYRNPGMRGWGHIDHRRFLPTVKAPMECENVTGASVLIRRKAFYDAKGFDEEFFLYAEDDALCLQIKQQGYKIVYTPLAIGTHLEGQTNAKMPDFNDRIQHGNRTFGKKWGWWIEKNLNTVPGTF
jgi:GT2 family glycosyltransferase